LVANAARRVPGCKDGSVYSHDDAAALYNTLNPWGPSDEAGFAIDAQYGGWDRRPLEAHSTEIVISARGERT
jgi:hypothetical protein